MDKRNVGVVLIRMDKIGDLVLSLPVDEHPAVAGRGAHWFISEGMEFVPSNAAPRREFTAFARAFSWGEWRRMVAWFKAHRPRTVVLLHNPWWVSFAAWWAGVPERIGRRSQWHGFLFINLPVKQKRSASDRHESDFNFDMVESGFARLGVKPTPDLERRKNSYLQMVAPNRDAVLNSRGLNAGGYRVVHPGMKGSALNWPSENFRALIGKLATDGPVVITGTTSDAEYLQGLESLRENPAIRWMVGALNPEELLAVLSGAKSVLAPSTGVLHLAASLGVPSVGIYSPRKVEHPRRWGPKGPHVRALLPEVRDGEEVDASTLARITVDEVLKNILELEPSRASADRAQT